jgi:hypothetical protein
VVVADLSVPGGHGNAEWRGATKTLCLRHLAAHISLPSEQCFPLLFQVHSVHTCVPCQCHNIYPTYDVATKKLQERPVSFYPVF